MGKFHMSQSIMGKFHMSQSIMGKFHMSQSIMGKFHVRVKLNIDNGGYMFKITAMSIYG